MLVQLLTVCLMIVASALSLRTIIKSKGIQNRVVQSFHRHKNHNYPVSRSVALRSFSLLMDTPVVIRGVEEIVDRYDIFLLDQFGVLHNGQEPLPGVPELLEYLQQKNKTTVILSNTSSKSEKARRRYKRLGLPEYYTDFVTSGEAAWKHIKENYSGKKCTWITWSSFEGDDFLSSLGVKVVPVEEADFLLFHGSQAIAAENANDAISIDLFEIGKVDNNLRHVLNTAKERNLTAICANVDNSARQGDKLAFMPGMLKQEYEKLGGEVVSFGKPYKQYFEAAVAAGKRSCSKKNPRVIHVGDSLHHDIAGG